MKTSYLYKTNNTINPSQSFLSPKTISKNAIGNDNSLKGSHTINSQMYLKKSSSLGKASVSSSIHKKNNSETMYTTASKHINSKKLASASVSHYVKASLKADYNTSFNYKEGNDNDNSCITKYQTNSFIAEGNNERNRTNKDRIITELKANYSQDKLRRRKILTVNTAGFNDNLNSFFESKDNNQLNKSNNYIDKKDQPCKLLYAKVQNNNSNETENNISVIKMTDPNNILNISSIKNNNNNLYTTLGKSVELQQQQQQLQSSTSKKDCNTFNSYTQPKLNQLLNELELQMDKELKDNIANSKSKKYNTLKHYFETSIKTIGKYNNNNRLLQKFLIGYHDVVSSFSIENRELKENNSILMTKLEKANQTVLDYEKQNMSQQSEIIQLKNRLKELERTHEQVVSNSTEHSTHLQESCGTDKDIRNKITNAQHSKVIDLNKKNLEDLDALYFLDKVNVNRSTSSNSRNIPRLNLK